MRGNDRGSSRKGVLGQFQIRYLQGICLVAFVFGTGCAGAGAGGDVPVTDVPADAQSDEPPAPEDSAKPDLPDLPPGQVPTESGLIEGKILGGATAFRGIPYAAPPTGGLRWRPPQPAIPWEGVRGALDWGMACPQEPSPLVEAPGFSEDCLTLNVWAPLAPVKPAPVMVFIHGGGFVMGSSASSTLDGTWLAANRGVVVVTLNYRLGPPGFLAHPALTAEDPTHPYSGNWGIEDQRAALAWVGRNIAAFGGDPGNVTLAGQSAGGVSVCIHLTSAASAGLFHKVILQSGPCMQNLPALAAAESQGKAMAKALGCGSDAAGCLRAAPVDALLSALPPKKGMFFGDGAVWEPVAVSATEQPFTLVSAPSTPKVPVILGSNGDEGSLLRFLAYSGGLDAKEYEAFVDMVFGTLAPEVLKRYPVSSYPSVEKALDALLGDFVFVCPVRRTARAMAKAGMDVHLYKFTHASGFMPLPGFGAYHGAELNFVFHTPPAWSAFTEAQEALSREVAGYWARFAHASDPEGEGAVSWPQTGANDENYLVLDTTIATEQGGYAGACDFWDGLPAKP